VSGIVDDAAWVDASVVEVSSQQSLRVVTRDAVAAWPDATKGTPA
jgi:hypothetical protein